MEQKKKELNWAILGTGVVANEMAQALTNSGKRVYSVGNRTYSKAIDFAKKYNIKKVYDDFHEMFNDDNVDVIYITTPHNTHIDFLESALSSGKHVLCEKSITLNSSELEKAKKLAIKNNVILAEAMTIYHMPIYKKLREMVSKGELGEVRMIQVNFGSYKEYDMNNRFFNMDLAGGALLDIGVYAITLARCFMQSKPNKVVSQVQYAPSGADEKSGILMMNEEGEMAVISLTLHSKQPKRAMISCDKGYIEIMEFPRGEEAVITYTATGEKQVISLGKQSEALKYEMEDMELAISGENNQMLLNYTTDVMDIMTQIRKEWGMVYKEEM